MKVLKKIGAWLILAVCTIMLVTNLITGFDLMAGEDVLPGSKPEIIPQFSVAVCFLIALCILGIVRSIQFIRAKPDVSKAKVPFTQTFKIHISGEIDFPTYRRFMLKSMLAHPFKILLFCLMVSSILTTVLSANNGIWQSTGILIIALLGPVFIVYRIFVYINQNYKASFPMGGNLEFTMTNDAFEANGQHLQSKLSWDFHQKILETKDFILLFQNESIATFLPKSKFQPADLELFLEYLQSLPIPYKKS